MLDLVTCGLDPYGNFCNLAGKLCFGLLVNRDNQKGEVSVPSCALLVENFPALEAETLPDSSAAVLCNLVALAHPQLKDTCNPSLLHSLPSWVHFLALFPGLD